MALVGRGHSVFPDCYQLLTEGTHLGRLFRRMEYSIGIRDGDFPAHDARIGRVTEEVSVEPAQVELSLRKGGNRTESISVRNDCLRRVKVSLKAESFQGDLDKSLRLRPDQFELPPGQRRKVTLTIDSSRAMSEHGYARASLTAAPETGEALGTDRIPVALLTNSSSLAKLVPGDPQWMISDDRSGVTLSIQNDSLRHVPLEGRLSLTNEFGPGFVRDARYGRWLMPCQRGEIFFGFREPPPPGTCDIRTRVQQNESERPLRISKTSVLQSVLEQQTTPEKVSRNSDEYAPLSTE